MGLHAQLLAQDHRYIMIDEPEAFLHPPLARRLGFNLSTLAAERGSCVFAATHSPDFLMGCIESGVGVNIVRLGYHNGVASAHLLPRDELETMMVDPLLRSTGILGALFHQAAVVVEGDSDRAFYSEVNERLRIHEPGIHPAVMRDCVFLNAQGKATVSRILEALRRLGVVSCGIVDLDLLKDNGVCKKLLEARGATEAVAESIGNTRASIQRSIADLKALCLPNGLARATEQERRSVQHFIHEMELHGIFLPEVGPVEGWLAKLGVSAHKNAWIPAIFKAMGPVNTGLKPSPHDVWKFIRRIGAYLDVQATPAVVPDPEADPPADA
ncbi:MAG TPA: TOPRIM nucleotidyl transferase/hydrolase domain-containing protein [Nannocystis sp.]